MSKARVYMADQRIVEVPDGVAMWIERRGESRRLMFGAFEKGLDGKDMGEIHDWHEAKIGAYAI